MTEGNDKMTKTQYNPRVFSFKKGKGIENKKIINDLYNKNKFNENNNDNYNPILNTETNAYANVIVNKNLFRNDKKRNSAVKNKYSKKLFPNINK